MRSLPLPTQPRRCAAALAWLIASLLTPFPALAQGSSPAALALVKQAVAAELRASKTDTTPWAYRDHDVQPGKDAVYEVVETPKGDLRRLLILNGAPVDGAARQREFARMRSLVDSPEEQARRRKSAEADGAQAHEFLTMLPNAFLWKIVAESPEATTLSFRPDPSFSPPDAQARVLGVMAGQMVVVREIYRIQSLRGTLTDDVKFGFGLFGRIDKGGTFSVERRELAPGKWQIAETHVHIGGRALLFKTIGQQEDEVKTDWHLSTAPDLQTALEQLQR